MNSILDLLQGQLGGQTLDAISSQLGMDKQATGSAVSAAIPVLISAMAKNASKPGGASALAGALDRDHDGSVLDDLAGFLGSGGNTTDGNGILNHVLGGKRQTVESGLANSSGLDIGAIGKLLPILAPVVMGALGRMKKDQGLDAGGLAQVLAGERSKAAGNMPQLGGLISLLDADGDGDVTDEIVGFGAKLLSKFFRKR